MMAVHTINWEALRAYCQKIFMSLGVPESEALVAADCLVDADLCGVESHGVSRMTVYTKRLETKVVSAVFKVSAERDYPAGLTLNGCNSMGMLVGKYAMEKCVERAKVNGSCFIAANNSNHYGMASYYVNMAARAGMIGLSATNAPPNIAPWGSYKAYVGTNPLAIAAPTNGEPVLLDMAPSVVAMGKVILAAKLGKPIPEGWALTKEGAPTTDPNLGKQGTVVPIGGPKGYGLSLFMDILCGILSGAQFGPYLGNMWNDFVNPQNVGHFFLALDISKFTDLEVFKKRVGQMMSDIKALPRNEGISELFLPGEIEQRRRAERKERGIPVEDVVYEELRALGQKYGVEFTL
jgi:LDH2 family malate/lactate/ureidoglycolate dehydrogenase